MLTLSLLVPLLAAVVVACLPRVPERTLRNAATLATAVPLLLLAAVWLRFDTGAGAPAFQAIEEFPWMPAIGVAWRLGVDGIALAIAGMSALLFVAAIAWPVETRGKAHAYYAWCLFLQSVSLGVFLALDLLVFYAFFDLSLVGMYFLISRWGHGEARAAALKFFLYTLTGSLAILLAIIALAQAGGPASFDMRDLIARQPLAGSGATAALVLFGMVFGFGIKTPLFPLHTWLPPAHVDAPAPASAILAGVLLKMGVYGLIRIPLSMMRETVAQYAPALGVLAVVSILWGALVALAQHDIKRRIAYTSVNHMGYAVLGVAAAAGAGNAAARQLALAGSVTELVAHGLITGALFLIAGAFWRRTHTYDFAAYGGLAQRAPRLTVATMLAAFASLGLPGLAGFVAEFQVFAGTFAAHPWLAAVGLLGLVITAALFLQMLQQLFFGELPAARADFADLDRRELGVLGMLLLLVVALGVYPAWLLRMIASAPSVLAGTP